MVEAFLGAAVAGFGALLMAVAALAWRRARDRKMAVLAAAFAAQAAGGAAMLAGELAGGGLQAQAAVAFAGATLASLVLLYAALFARRAR
jgi:hypothetical protein